MITERFNEILHAFSVKLGTIIADSVWGSALLGLAMLIIISLAFFLLWQKRRVQILSKEISMIHTLLDYNQLERGVEHAIYTLLEQVHSLIDATGYYFYIKDETNGQYILKALRTREQEAEIGPSYSGLVPYKGDTYAPPLTLNITDWGNEPEIVMDGNIPLLQLVFTGQRGLVRLGPIREIPGGSRKLLCSLQEVFSYILENSLERVALKTKVAERVTSSKAMQNITSITMDITSALNIVMSIAVRMIGSSGAFFCSEYGKDSPVLYSSGLDPETEEMLKQDKQGIANLNSMLGDNEFRALNTEDKDFYKIPTYLAATGIELFLLVGVRTESSSGLAVFFYNKLPDIEFHRLTVLQMIFTRIGDLLDNYKKHQERADYYINMLKMLVQTTDNLEAYTVGYSELVSRYAEAIAREMNLSEEETEDIALAAYLSNLGVLGFSTDLLFKEGKYTEFEFETMKLHAEVGANIVESTIGNSKVAAIIRYHHERTDGNGYPAGLKGQDIPLGSRIIAVVQTFLAKINGRSYRTPLTFEESVEILKSASGSQLDPLVVEALLSWFAKKQANPKSRGHSLGPCWDMLCAPLSICQKCPAYQNQDKNCWQVDGTHCVAHGNRCDTCFVYSEYAFRMAPKAKA